MQEADQQAGVGGQAGPAGAAAAGDPAAAVTPAPAGPVAELADDPPPRAWEAEQLPPRPKARRSGGLGFRLFVLCFLTALAMLVATLRNQPIPMPVWIVAELEARADRALGRLAPGTRLSLGGASLAMDEDFAPRIDLQDLSLIAKGGQELASLPKMSMSARGAALMLGRVEPVKLQISGAALGLERLSDGSFNLALRAAEGTSPRITSAKDVFDLMERALALPALASLQSVGLDGFALSYRDLASGRQADIGDGSLAIERQDQRLATRLAASLTFGGGDTARLEISGSYLGGQRRARLQAVLGQGLSVADIASQFAALGILSVVDAPVSAEMEADLSETGPERVDALLTLGAGVLKPNANAAALEFDAARLSLGFDGQSGRLSLRDVTLSAPLGQLRAHGHVLMRDKTGAPARSFFAGTPPDSYLVQLTLDQMALTGGMFEATPIKVQAGGADLKLRLQPFAVDLGQAYLQLDHERLTARGRISTGASGWRLALDFGLDQVGLPRLMALWPPKVIPLTRAWVQGNLQAGQVRDLQGGLRLVQGAKPILELGFDFADLAMTYAPHQPPIHGGRGHGALQQNRLIFVLDTGYVETGAMGQARLDGSSFEVLDITKPPPADGRLRLRLDAPLGAVLSILDRPGLQVLSKANLPVDLGQGRVTAQGTALLPLKPKLPLWETVTAVSGQISDLSSEALVPGKRLKSDALSFDLTQSQVTIQGPARLEGMAIEARFAQSLDPKDRLKGGDISGTARLAPAPLAALGLALPEGMIKGEAAAEFTLALRPGALPALRLSSQLRGMGVTISELGWAKPAGAAARFDLEARLGRGMDVPRLSLRGEGLALEGTVAGPGGGAASGPGGGNLLRLSRIEAGAWFRGRADIPLAPKAGTAGRSDIRAELLDLRRLPKGGAMGQGGGTGASRGFDLQADRVVLSDGIVLTDLAGRFASRPGLSGEFRAALGGRTPVQGVIAPTPNGTGLRLTSQDAGAALAAAGVLASAVGGRMELTLVPRAEAGFYDGQAQFRDFRIRHSSGLSELLNAISVVGLLQALDGAGIAFDTGQADFTILPGAVELRQASAIGASMGISLDGVYQMRSGRIDLRGTISPLYFLNGIGQVLTRSGEGLFGFDFRLGGTAKDVKVSVNPLSILTPGMFREIFRGPAPRQTGN